MRQYRTHKETVGQDSLDWIYRTLGNFRGIVVFPMKQNILVGYICTTNAGKGMYGTVNIDRQILKRMTGSVINSVILSNWPYPELTVIARRYIEHTIRTRGQLVRPVDDLLTSTQSAVKKRAVKMPLCSLSTHHSVPQLDRTTHRRSSIQEQEKQPK